MMVPELKRLLFRPYGDEDFEFLFSMVSDPDVMRFIGNGQTRDRQGAARFLDWIRDTYRNHPGMGLMLLVRKADGVPIGHAGLVPQVVDGIEETEVGYWIASAYWGQGYASEAGTAVRDYGIRHFSLPRLICIIQPGNAASRRVATKIGMTMEKATVFHGQDVLIYSLGRVREPAGGLNT